MRPSVWNVAAVVALAWLITPLLLGGSTSGVYLNSVPAAEGQPACETDHIFSARNWGGFDTIRYDVWVDGCVDANGRLQLNSSKCSAKSFLGDGTATCTATQDANRLKVNLSLSYPLGIGLIAGYPTAPTFYLSPSSYSTY